MKLAVPIKLLPPDSKIHCDKVKMCRFSLETAPNSCSLTPNSKIYCDKVKMCQFISGN